jgi:hypothetical protein
MITGLYSASGGQHPHPVHHRPGAARPSVQGRLPGRGHRVDRQAGDQDGGDGARAGAGAAGLPAGVPPDAQRPPRSGADRPAVRRADGRDRVRPETYEPLPVYKPAPARKQIEKALDMLNEAERPLIVAGGGIINADASDLLVEFAELVNVPVIPTLMGWGAIPDDHPLMAGMVGLQTSHRYGNATMLASRLRAGHRQPLGQPPHRQHDRSTPRAAPSCTWTSSPRRSAACSCPTSASSRREGGAGTLRQVARERKARGKLK